MQKHFYKFIPIAIMVILAAGCGKTQNSTAGGNGIQQGELEEHYVTSEELGYVPTIYETYAEDEEYPELAEFLASYYGIPEDQQTETRYYYNKIDMNEDGNDEIFAVVIGEYTEGEAGDPALLLADEDGIFTVIEDFEQIRTPLTVSENITNGWHDIIFDVYGKGVEDGRLICHYNPEGGYQTDINEFQTEPIMVSGTRILSNNLIDDMDRGRYFTLKK